MSCIERDGWFSGLLSAVKLNQSFSISGPSAVEADRAPDLLDALPGADHRMDAAAAAAAAGQRDVERLLGEARGELRVGERRARASSAASIFCLAR